MVKNKLFFFFGYQDTITRQDPVANPTATFVPTAAMLQGDFTPVPAASASVSSRKQSVPSLLDPASLKLAALLPPGTGPCGNTSFGLITQVNENQYVGRGDYQISAKDTLFGRYIRTHFYRPPSYDFTPDNILSTAQGGLNDADQSWVVGETHLFSSTLVNQFRASVDRIAVHRFSPNYVSICDLGVDFYCGYMPHQSGFTVLGAFSVGPGTGGQAAAHSTPIQLNNDVSWVHGSHQINFGGGGEVSKMLFYGNVYAQSLWTFPNIPQFLLGTIQFQRDVFAQRSAAGKVVHELLCAGHLEGDSRLTVNLGLRWEPFFPPKEINGSVYNFSLPNLIAGVKSTQFVNAPPGLSYPGDPGFIDKTGEQNQWKLFAPRVALAWDPKGDGKMVIRSSLRNLLRLRRR